MSDEPTDELLRRLEKALSNLPRKQRYIFLAHRVEGLTYGQIASRNGLTLRHVEQQMANAIRKLDKQLHGRKLSWWERWF